MKSAPITQELLDDCYCPDIWAHVEYVKDGGYLTLVGYLNKGGDLMALAYESIGPEAFLIDAIGLCEQSIAAEVGCMKGYSKILRDIESQNIKDLNQKALDDGMKFLMAETPVSSVDIEVKIANCLKVDLYRTQDYTPKHLPGGFI